MPSTPTILRATSPVRPVTQATRAYRPARRSSSARVSAGTAASSGRSTIGASTPSTSRNSAAARGSEAISVSASTRLRVGDVRPTAQLVAVGVVGGLFGALFGVGGGIVIVPLLLVIGYGQRQASATSLAAILVSSIVGATTYAFHGDVRVGAAALVGLPAMFGAVVGTGLQQRIPVRRLSYLFALLLAAVGIRLLV